MKGNRLRSALFAICLLLSMSGFSQIENRGIELGFKAGITYYTGDLNTSFDLTKPGVVLNAAGRYNFNNRVSVAVLLNAARVGYKDAYSDNNFQQARNLSFRTDMLDLETRVEFNFLEYIHGDYNYSTTPYMHAGFSFMYFNPTAEYEGERYNLRSLGTEGQAPGSEYFNLQPSLSYGVGMKIDLNYRWSLQIDLSSRLLFHDYIDDVSTTYPGESEIRSLRGSDADVAVALSDRSIESEEFPQIGEPGRQRGNGKNNDTVSFISVGAFYFFGKLRCPKISPLY